ncbi:MAG: bifunctional adenosylcobinamide kinase/adenosylcobinamide-phosphate guanylyltransferase [Actinomycetota bacterium]
MSIRLLIGGARAGKSTIAAKLATAIGAPVTFVATAEVGDEEMERRIAWHRADRPAEWITIEEPIDLVGAIGRAGAGTVIVDCLTLWTSNLMLSGLSDGEIEQRAAEVARLTSERASTSLVVTNEVGMGVVPASEMGRRFRDLLGRVNSLWADEAAEVLLVVAGRATRVVPVDS